MDKKQWYEDGQALWVEENNVKVGDKVRVLRHFGEDELGFSEAGSKCSKEKAGFVGRTLPICSIANNWIRLDSKSECGWNYAFPFFVLEIVERAPAITCKFFADGKEFDMSPESARNYHKAAAKE